MPKVKFQDTADEKEVSQGADLKDVTRDAGWPIAYACEEGVCGTCIITVPEGKENVSEMTETEKQTLSAMGMDPQTHRLGCQCKINGDCTISGQI